MLRIAVGGAFGTALRLLMGAAVVGGLVLGARPPGLVVLLAVNTLGAGLLGFVLVRRPLPEHWMPALTTGALGGFTTFSTLVVQAGTLGHDAGFVASDSARMTGAGLGLVAAFLMLSIALGVIAYVGGRAVGRRPVRV